MRRVLYCLPGHVKTEYQDRGHYKVNGEDIIERLVAHERRHTSRSCVIVSTLVSICRVVSVELHSPLAAPSWLSFGPVEKMKELWWRVE